MLHFQSYFASIIEYIHKIPIKFWILNKHFYVFISGKFLQYENSKQFVFESFMTSDFIIFIFAPLWYDKESECDLLLY